MAEVALDRLVHDLFGPLTVIRGVCAALARDEAHGAHRAGLALIDAETMRLAAGLDGLARAATRRPASAAPAEAVCLAALARSAVERHRAAGAERRVAVVARLNGAPPVVTAAPDDLRRALDNLVQNALRHAASLVRVAAGRRGGWGYLRVADDGPGRGAGGPRAHLPRGRPRQRPARGRPRPRASRSPATSSRRTAGASRSTPSAPGRRSAWPCP